MIENSLPEVAEAFSHKISRGGLQAQLAWAPHNLELSHDIPIDPHFTPNDRPPLPLKLQSLSMIPLYEHWCHYLHQKRDLSSMRDIKKHRAINTKASYLSYGGRGLGDTDGEKWAFAHLLVCVLEAWMHGTMVSSIGNYGASVEVW